MTFNLWGNSKKIPYQGLKKCKNYFKVTFERLWTSPVTLAGMTIWCCGPSQCSLLTTLPIKPLHCIMCAIFSEVQVCKKAELLMFLIFLACLTYFLVMAGDCLPACL